MHSVLFEERGSLGRVEGIGLASEVLCKLGLEESRCIGENEEVGREVGAYD